MGVGGFTRPQDHRAAGPDCGLQTLGLGRGVGTYGDGTEGGIGDQGWYALVGFLGGNPPTSRSYGISNL